MQNLTCYCDFHWSLCLLLVFLIMIVFPRSVCKEVDPETILEVGSYQHTSNVMGDLCVTQLVVLSCSGIREFKEFTAEFRTESWWTATLIPDTWLLIFLNFYYLSFVFGNIFLMSSSFRQTNYTNIPLHEWKKKKKKEQYLVCRSKNGLKSFLRFSFACNYQKMVTMSISSPCTKINFVHIYINAYNIRNSSFSTSHTAFSTCAIITQDRYFCLTVRCVRKQIKQRS